MSEPDISAAMRRLGRAIKARLHADDRADLRAARATVPRGKLAGYDVAALGRLVRPKLERDGRGWRAVAAEIGVTASDLSRIMAGQQIAAGKVFALCDWARVDPRRFYRPPAGARTRPRAAARKARPARTAFHGKSTETEAS